VVQNLRNEVAGSILNRRVGNSTRTLGHSCLTSPEAPSQPRSRQRGPSSPRTTHPVLDVPASTYWSRSLITLTSRAPEPSSSSDAARPTHALVWRPRPQLAIAYGADAVAEHIYGGSTYVLLLYTRVHQPNIPMTEEGRYPAPGNASDVGHSGTARKSSLGHEEGACQRRWLR
jgi:hypothetical protein